METSTSEDSVLLTSQRPRGVRQITFILLRNAIPIVGLAYYGWSTAQFLLLSQFGLAAGMATVAAAGAAADDRRAGKSRWATWNKAGVGWLQFTLLFTFLGSLWLFFAGQMGAALSAPGTFSAAGAITLGYLPALLDELRINSDTRLSEYQLRNRMDSLVNPLYAGILISFLLGCVLVQLEGKRGSPGILHGVPNAIVIVQLVVTLVFGLVRELWPDWLHERLRRLWG